MSATVTIGAHAFLPVGGQLSASKTITIVDPPAASTMFGVDPSRSGPNSLPGSDFANDIAWFPGALVGATYGHVGEGCLPWSSPWVAPMADAGYQVTFSAKDYTSAVVASFKANWDNMPPPRPGKGRDPHKYILFHEANRPAGGPVLATWRSTMGMLLAAAAVHKNADRIEIGINLSWWPAQIADNEAIPWQDLMMAGIKFVSWDQYWGNGMGIYAGLDKFTALPAASATYLDGPALPVLIREFGVTGSQTDATAAQIIRDIVPVYRAKGFESVSYFNYRAGVSGAWITETGRPLAFAAWKGVCAAQH